MNTTKQAKQQKPRPKGKGKQRLQKKIERNRITKGKIENAVKPGGMQVVTTNVTNQNLKKNIAVTAIFDDSALDLSFASVYAFYASKGLMLLSDEDKNDPVVIANGLGYLYETLATAIKSGTITASKAPAFIIDLMRALNSKNVTFMKFAKMNFSWNETPTFGGFPTININGGIWKPTVVLSDNGTYNSPVSFPSPDFSPENYSATLSKLEGVTTMSAAKLKDPASYISVLDRDVSTFARAYIYNGLTPSQAGGYYKDIELEVGITAPMLSAFARYGDIQAESRVPTKLHAYGGDAAIATGWPLHPTFVSYFNKRSPAFKCVDFEWICFTLTMWMAQAVDKAISSGKWTYGNQVPCTYQDFRIVLRQALLNVFDSQYMVQFTGPLAFGTNDNGFVPFQVNGHSYGSQTFSTFMLPALLKENLNALKARTLKNKTPGASRINAMTFFPVLGRYVTDTPPVPQVVPSGGQSAYPLFQTTPQETINLIDGSTSPGNYVNLNGTHYQTAMAAWSSAVETVLAVVSPVSNIIGDQGPLGLGALYYTAVVESGQANFRNAAPTQLLRSPYMKYVQNGFPEKEVKLERTDSTKGKKPSEHIKALPPATITGETLKFTTSVIPPNTEMQTFLDSIIVPVIRLDPAGSDDQLSLQMYQVETKEGISSKYEGTSNAGGGGVASRLSRLAQYCITDIGHDSSGEYQKIMEQLAIQNDAGMLAGLLGGIAKSFLPPDAHGIVDTVADVLPF